MKIHKPLTFEDVCVIIMALRNIEYTFPAKQEKVRYLIRYFEKMKQGLSFDIRVDTGKEPEGFMYTEGEQDETH